MKRKFGFSLLVVALLAIIVGCQELMGAQGFDVEAPVITLSGDAEVYVLVGDDYLEAGATAVDNVDGNLSSEIVISGAVNTSVTGIYTVRYNVKDFSGNQALEVRRVVQVTSGENPEITLEGESEVLLFVGEDFTDEGCTATDMEDGDITADVVTDGEVNTSTVGSYTITYNVTDSHGNVALEVVRTVTVAIGNIPVITLVGDAEVSLYVGELYADDGVTADDVEDGDLTADVVTEGTVDTTTAGVYTITYNVTDSNGNVAVEVIRVVTVMTGDIPVITLVGDAAVTVYVGDDYTDAGVTAADTEDGDIITDVVTAGTVDTATVGEYTITYNVTDSHGNAAVQVVRTITVEAAPAVPVSVAFQASHSMEVDTTYNIGGGNVTFSDETSKGVGPAEGTFSSSDTNIAYVENNILYAVADGTCTITFHYTEGDVTVSADMALTVNLGVDPVVVPVSVAFQGSHTMDAGGTYNIGGGNVSFSDETSRGVGPAEGTFSTSDNTIAYVENNVLYAVAAGTCTITFHYTENDVTVSADMALTVNAAPEGPVVPVSVAFQGSHVMDAGGTYNIGGGNVSFSDNTSKGVGPAEGTFSTSDNTIAYVENNVLYAVAAGTCTITFHYTENDVTVSADMALTVNAAPEGPVVPVSVAFQGSHVMDAGGTYNIGGGNVSFSDNTSKGVGPAEGTFSTSDNTIAYVENNVLYAVAAGTCTITFHYTENDVTVSADMALTVNAAPEGPVVPVSVAFQGSHVMDADTTYNIGGGNVSFSDNTSKGVGPADGTFSTSDNTIAYVENNVLYAVAAGTCTITFHYTENDVTVSADMALTVNAAVPVSSLPMPYGIYSEGTDGIVLGTNGTNGIWTNGTYAMNVSDTTDVYEGTEAISYTYDANSIGGGYIAFSAPANITDATELVFTIKPSVAFTAAEIKLEWTGGHASVDITSYTPVSSNGWDTYTIPLSDFTGINKEAINVAWSLWHPNGGYTGVIYIDNIIYQ